MSWNIRKNRICNIYFRIILDYSTEYPIISLRKLPGGKVYRTLVNVQYNLFNTTCLDWIFNRYLKLENSKNFQYKKFIGNGVLNPYFRCYWHNVRRKFCHESPRKRQSHILSFVFVIKRTVASIWFLFFHFNFKNSFSKIWPFHQLKIL